MNPIDGSAIVYCEGAYNTPNGKTAHGLVRFTHRYRVLSVIDSRYAGKDAAEVLDGKSKGIPVFGSLADATRHAVENSTPATHFVVGLAPDGGRLSPAALSDVKTAISLGLHIDAGLHDFLTENPDLVSLAAQHQVRLRDVRKPPPRSELHFFSSKIEQVTSLKVAMLGTDSAVGKRTSAWILARALQDAGCSAEMVGTGQTAWMQGARYGVIMDSLVNDFVSGEIEHAVWQAWHEARPDVIIIEGQGSLMNPAYPGGFEILAGGRPDIVVMQHAPARKEYDGFPGYPLHPLTKQIQAVELLSGKPVIAITVNHENLPMADVPFVCRGIENAIGLPAYDVLLEGGQKLAEVVMQHLKERD